MEIERVEQPHRETDFYLLPYRLYRDDRGWVGDLISDRRELLNRDRNPFFEHLDASFFLARRNGRAVGRIAAIDNTRHNEYHDENTAFFGFLVAEDDPDLFSLLLDTVTEWAREEGFDTLRGPCSYSSNDEWGALVEGFDRIPALMMPYNPPYLPKYIEANGFAKANGLLAYEMDTSMVNTRLLERIAGRVQEGTNLTVRTINMEDYENETRLIRELYVNCWKDNWGFVPPTESEFLHATDKMKPIVVPNMVLFGEDDGEEIGFIIGLPDLNRAFQYLNGSLLSWRAIPFFWKLFVTGLDRIRVLLMGVREDYRKRGIETWLIYELIDRAVNREGFNVAELSWILEQNKDMSQVLEKLGASLESRYHVYEKSV